MESGEMAESSRESPYNAWSALVNSPNSALFKSDTAQNDMVGSLVDQ